MTPPPAAGEPTAASELRLKYASGWRPVPLQDDVSPTLGDGLLWAVPDVWLSVLVGPSDIQVVKRKTKLIQKHWAGYIVTPAVNLVLNSADPRSNGTAARAEFLRRAVWVQVAPGTLQVRSSGFLFRDAAESFSEAYPWAGIREVCRTSYGTAVQVGPDSRFEVGHRVRLSTGSPERDEWLLVAIQGWLGRIPGPVP